MKTTPFRSLRGSFTSRGLKLRLCCVFCWMVATVRVYADSTISITVPPGGYALIANELANGNTLDSILPNVPGGSTAGNTGTLLLERNCVTGTFSTYFYKSSGIGGVGWRLSTSPSTPAGSLVPGQGAIIQNRTTTNYTYMITGTGYSPVLPQSFSCGCGNYYLLSGQTNIPAAYEDIVGLPPLEGTRLFRYNSGSATVPFPPQAPNYTVYTYLGGTWTPSIPVAATGESVWIYPPCSTNSSCLVLGCSTNFTIACGTNWNFGTPSVLSNCCTNVTSVSTTVTNGVFCPQTVTRSWLFTDACGNSSLCSQTVTVVDTTPQIIACASNKSVCSSCLLSTSLPAYSVLWDFVSGSGVYPIAALAQGSDGTIYGTAGHTVNGPSGAGGVFSINPDGTSYTPIHIFGGSDGAFPDYATLLVGNDGEVYGTTPLGGNFESGALFTMNPDGNNETILHSFISGGSDGYIPKAGVVQDSNGTLYGTTQSGGNSDVGTVFTVSTSGSGFSTLHGFDASSADGHSPNAGVVIGSGGVLYGTTVAGGGNGLGTVYRLNTNGTAETVLHNFSGGGSDGSSPYGGLLLGNDGMLYGTTYGGGSGGVGTVFRLDTNGGNYSVLHSFLTSDGAYCYATLVQGCDGALYGTTYQGGANGLGTVFRLNADGTSYVVLHDFGGNDGQNPYGGLMIGADGAMYGTAAAGGANGQGTIFKLTWPGGWSFDAPTVSDPCSNYTLSVVSTVTAGDCPRYSTRTWLLTDPCGNTNTCSQTVTLNSAPPIITCASNKTVGSIQYCVGTGQPSNSVLHSFSTADGGGSSPVGELLQGSDGALYGITQNGGSDGQGTVFTMGADGTGHSLLHTFLATGGDGQNPSSGLVQGQDGALYGATTGGGSGDFGTIFKVKKNGTGYSVLYSFAASGADGFTPRGSLVEGSRGFLYGTALQGGGGGRGTVFKVNTNGTGFAVLHSFLTTGGDGQSPYAAVVHGKDGMLYGTTGSGGSSGRGTVFKVNTNGTGYAVMHSFSTIGGDGQFSYSRLLQGSDGVLYGTTANGGSGGEGTVFRISTNGTAYKVLYNFSATGGDGQVPNAGLIMGCGGSLYGTTPNGGNSGAGTVFKLNQDGTGYRVLYSFNPFGGDGQNPYSGLVEGRDDALYGTTQYGGTGGGGTVFRLGASYAWTFDEPVGAVSCSGGSVTIAAVNTVTNGSCPQLVTQTWQATDRCGNVGTCSQTVTVQKPPVITPSPTVGASPFLVSLSFFTPGCESMAQPVPVSVYWDFGDGTFANLTNNTTDPIFHTYGLGSYTLTLVTTDLDGFSITNTQPNLITVLTPFAAWQSQYFYCTDCVDAAETADPDGDGQNNLAEFLAGTDPTASTSAFRILSVIDDPQDGVGIVTWLTTGGHTNFVQASSGGPNGRYTTNFTDISGPIVISGSGDTITNYTDIGGATNRPSRYYRIRLAP